MDLNVKVAVRCRPMSSKESSRGSISVVTMIDRSVHITNSEGQQGPKEFTFDYCYSVDSTQVEVYADLGMQLYEWNMLKFYLWAPSPTFSRESLSYCYYYYYHYYYYCNYTLRTISATAVLLSLSNHRYLIASVIRFCNDMLSSSLLLSLFI